MRFKAFTMALAIGTAAGLPALARAGEPQGARAQEDKGAGVSESDMRFMDSAARGGLAEVALGKLAEDRGSSEGVKDFGRRMVEDHTRINQELSAMAQRKGVTLPGEMSSDEKKEYQKLAGLSGEAFDREYIRHMVDDHEHDVAAFKQASLEADDPELKEWAGATLSTLEDHLRDAKGTRDTVRGPIPTR